MLGIGVLGAAALLDDFEQTFASTTR